jgi:hypothetical protein
MRKLTAICFVSAVAVIASVQASVAIVTMVPCGDYVMPAPPLAHIATPVHFKAHRPVRHHVHRGGRRGVMRALHAVAAASRPMCPVWLDESLGGPAGAVPAGWGGWSEGGFGGFGGGEEGAGGFGAGGGGGGSDIQIPFFVVDFTPPGPPVTQTFTPPCIDCGPPISTPTPVPEMSTWIMAALGFSALGILRWRRA